MNDFPKTRDLPGGNCTIAWPIDYFVSHWLFFGSLVKYRSCTHLPESSYHLIGTAIWITSR